MEPIPLSWAAEALGAEVLGMSDNMVQSVCTDTRQSARDALFFALQGENSDGHDYVLQAFAAGAVGAVVSRPVPGATGPLLVVPDTVRALGDLAAHYRRRFDIPVVGVTGSVGKTSTKEMIAAVLRTQTPTLISEKNFNTEIGVPLTLFNLSQEHGAAVLEMGMRGSGQIDRLAEIAQPTIAVITNIGYAHIELLGSQQNIAQAKAEILKYLPENGVAVLPGSTVGLIDGTCGANGRRLALSRNPMDEDFSEFLRRQVPAGRRVLTFGVGGDSSLDVRAYSVQEMPDGSRQAHVVVGDEATILSLRAIGYHHLKNAVAALAVGYALGVPLPQAVGALEAWKGAEGRMAIIRTPDGLTLLDDCYNAGPESMEAALITLFEMAGGGGVAVLGDMRELGDFAAKAHRFVGRKVLEADVRLLVTVGELAEEIGREVTRQATQPGIKCPAIRRFANAEEASAGIGALVGPGDTVLVKGSRAMQMEKIVAALTHEQGAYCHA